MRNSEDLAIASNSNNNSKGYQDIFTSGAGTDTFLRFRASGDSLGEGGAEEGGRYLGLSGIETFKFLTMVEQRWVS